MDRFDDAQDEMDMKNPRKKQAPKLPGTKPMSKLQGMPAIAPRMPGLPAKPSGIKGSGDFKKLMGALKRRG